MGWIGQTVGTALSAAGSVVGGILATKSANKQIANVKAQQQKNQDWYDRRYNEDATQRADAQRILTQTSESIKQRNKQAAGNQAVMGGTEESVAAAKMANNQALADATSQISANADARKDNIEATYMENDNAYENQLNQIQAEKTQAIVSATQGVADAGASISSMF